ncbi:unnamed protein product [Clonostachys byssicola]|uniref:Uncharacterized protein n=1 Tax=Clonostachys byssicola TaxID=160290 RepID=A0A9N9U3X6_9HYPO|nr:unnamed protein product [Clonostachys byssicola]
MGTASSYTSTTSETSQGSQSPLPLALPHTLEFMARLFLADKDAKSLLNGKGRDGMNSLHFAVKHSDVQLVQFTLEHGADPDMRDSEGQTPLHLAARSTSSTSGMVAACLLKHGADPNLLANEKVDNNFNGFTDVAPLHLAADRGNLRVAEQLIEGKTQVDIIDPQHFSTPLFTAVAAGQAGLVKFLLTKGAKVDGDPRAPATPLHTAVTHERIDILQILLCCGANLDVLNEDGKSAIQIAACNGSMETVKLLLAVSGGKLNMEDGTSRPAWWA